MIRQNENHSCKECNIKTPSFIKLLKHISENHTKEAEEEKEFEKTDKCEEGEKERVENFVFSG